MLASFAEPDDRLVTGGRLELVEHLTRRRTDAAPQKLGADEHGERPAQQKKDEETSRLSLDDKEQHNEQGRRRREDQPVLGASRHSNPRKR